MESQANSNKNNRRIAQNTIFLYIRQFLTMAVALYTSRVVLQALGTVDYGIYNVVGGMVTMFSFLNSSLAQATQGFIAFGIEKDSIKEQQNIFSMLLNVHILIAIILFILCETVGVWLFYDKLVIPSERLNAAFWVMQCSIFTLMITVTQVPYNASIFGHERMKTYAYVSIIEVSLKLGIVILLQCFFNDKLLAYGIMLMCVQISIAMIYRLYCLRKFNNCNYHFYWSNGLFKRIFGFSSWSMIGNLAFTLNNQGMNFLINIFFGPVYNAAKGIATAVEAAINAFVTNFLSASIPRIIKSYAVGDLEYCYRLNFKSSKFGFFLFMLVSLPLISVIDIVLSIWLVNVPSYTSIFCVLSLLYIQTQTMGGTLQNVVQATGKIRNFQLFNGILKLLPLPIVYVLYKLEFQVNTYLYVLIVTSIIGLFVQLLATKSIIRDFPALRFLKEVIVPEIKTFLIPCIISLYFRKISHSDSESFIICIVTFVISLASVWFIGLTKSEKAWICFFVFSRMRKYHT